MKIPEYKKSDFGSRMTWNEYGTVVLQLARKINKYIKARNIHIDAVIPIGRAGYIPGTVIAYQLKLLRILPVQYKYLDGPGGVKLRKLFYPELKRFRVGKKPVFLVVENNHCFATTAKTVVAELKKSVPRCTIIYAAVLADYSYQKMTLPEKTFYGGLTNETKTLSPGAANKLKIRTKLSLYPWENVGEELAAVQLKKYKYN